MGLRNFLQGIASAAVRPGKGPDLLKRGILGTLGFVLSPLSWWNDLLVNVPLAYGFAWAAGRLLHLFMEVHGWLFLNLFMAGYFLTNLAGFMLIHYSIFGPARRAGSMKKQVLASLVYTLAILLFFSLDICNPEKGCALYPHWVEP